MKRRKFIQASLVGPVAMVAAGRLHGTPASIDPQLGAAGLGKFMLPLADAGIPHAGIADLSRVSALVESVLTDPSQAAAFFSSPASYFNAHGLDGSDATLVDGSVSMLVALSDPAVKETFGKGDYRQLFDYLAAAGVFEARDPSRLQQRVQQLMETNIEEIRRAIAVAPDVPLTDRQRADFMLVLKQFGVTATEDDLAAVAQVLEGGAGAAITACSAMAACVVGIALMAALYVSVAIAVTVAVLAAISISAAIMTAIVVEGRERPDPSATSVPFSGQLIRLDPVAYRNAQRAFRLAAIKGDPSLWLHALRVDIRDEVEAVLTALTNLQLINIRAADLPLAIEALTCYAEKTAGVGVKNGV